MPGGIDNPAVGYTVFCAIKLVGYSAVAALISRKYHRPDRSAILVGLTRTLIGMAAGAAYFALWYALQIPPDFFIYLAGLIPIRFFEWWLLLLLFYRPLKSSRDTPTIALATGASYILDIPATFGFILTGGVWIC
jgi:hypothetical protein